MIAHANRFQDQAQSRTQSSDLTFFADDGGVLVPVQLSYGAIAGSGRRRSVQTATRGEDFVLKAKDRTKLQATTRDDFRNKVLLAWMVRRHLDHVSRFEPHVRTGDLALDKELMGLLMWHARRDRFDVGRRHSRNEAMRLFEACKVLDGDAAFIKLVSGQLQAVESDRIAKCTKFDKADGLSQAEKKAITDKLKGFTDTGLLIDPSTGAVEEYALCKRSKDGKTLQHDHFEPWQNILFDGYFSRFDQYRGISPLAASLNTLADISENWDYTNLKIKMHALFGVAIHRNEADDDDLDDDGTASAEDTTTNVNDDKSLEVTDTPQIVDLDEAHKIQTIESQTPAQSVVPYSELMVRVVLLALDIPYTMFDSMKSSFSARIADREEYEESAASKREKNQYVLGQYCDWKIAQWWETDSGPVARMRAAADEAKIGLLELQRSVEWVPAGRPWLDKAKQIGGETLAISAGLESPQRVLKGRGIADWRSVVDEISDFNEYAAEKGNVPILTGKPGQMTVAQILSDEGEDEDPAADVVGDQE